MQFKPLSSGISRFKFELSWWGILEALEVMQDKNYSKKKNESL